MLSSTLWRPRQTKLEHENRLLKRLKLIPQKGREGYIIHDIQDIKNEEKPNKKKKKIKIQEENSNMR